MGAGSHHDTRAFQLARGRRRCFVREHGRRRPLRAQRLLAMTPLAAVVRLAAPTTVVMAVSAVSNVVYTYFVSRLGVDAIAAVSLVFPVSLLALTAMGGGAGSGAASGVESPSASDPSEATLTRSVVPVARSWTKTSHLPFVSPATRFAWRGRSRASPSRARAPR